MQEKNGESKETTCANVRNSNNILLYVLVFFKPYDSHQEPSMNRSL